jgi:hypothetical protein
MKLANKHFYFLLLHVNQMILISHFQTSKCMFLALYLEIQEAVLELQCMMQRMMQ